MTREKRYNGLAVALAWPQTYCKQPGSWYDPLALLLGINHNHYYKVGHAALVLIDSHHVKAHYFDFGRYHAPYKHGRVRSAVTDHELVINTVPRLSNDGAQLANYQDILGELQSNHACHGEGTLYASYCSVDVNKALAKAHAMIKQSPIPYGPFKYGGSNCSRFVNSVIRAGKPRFRHRIRLQYKVPLTPTPISNVHALDHKQTVQKPFEEIPFRPLQNPDKKLLKNTLPPPHRHHDIPDNAQWLSGEGAGSWFVCEWKGELLDVTRYSPHGIIECQGLYKNMQATKKIKDKPAISVTYPSNCNVVSLHTQDGRKLFQRVDLYK